MKRTLTLLVLICIFNISQAQSWKDTVNIINRIFDRYKPSSPGCQLSISRNGKVIFSNARGLADLENHTPYTTETITEAGSISKQFVAASILILEQQGKLSLTDDVHKYFPKLSNYGSIITLENLLHHTSGLREWSSLVAITGWPRTTKAYRNSDVLNLLYRQQRLNNEPGTEFIYSNSNYILLTMIVEKVSGMKLADFTNKYIFIPAGMFHSSWRDDYKKVVINRGIAYSKKGNNYFINMPDESVYGPGGLLTTTEDLLKWNDLYLTGKLGGASFLEKQLSTIKLKGGAISNYASGLFVDTLKGTNVIYHDGQTAGYVGLLVAFPKLRLSIAWLSNTTEFKDSLFDDVTAIENLFIKDEIAQTHEKKVIPTVVNIETLKNYTGWYSYGKTDEGVRMDLFHDTLVFNTVPLIPINKTDFIYESSTIRFNRSKEFSLFTFDKRNLQFKKENESKLTTEYLNKFIGKYFSRETATDLMITLKDGKLLLEKDYLADVTLLHTYNGAFTFFLNLDSNLNPQKANILFEQDSKNNVTGCKISMNDARDIIFSKVQ